MEVGALLVPLGKSGGYEVYERIGDTVQEGVVHVVLHVMNSVMPLG